MNIGAVVITGAAGAIGGALARKFMERGSAALLVDVSEAALKKLAESLEGRGLKNFKALRADVSKEESWREAASVVESDFGASLGALINNAGIGVSKPVEDLDFAEWRRVIDTNLSSVFFSAKHCARFLRKGGGAMLNIASTRALQSEPNTEAYSASKGGIVAITHALAMSLAPVRVNCVSPGWLDNGSFGTLTKADMEQHPAGRVGEPSDIASLAYFLCDPSESSFITGQNFYCDGGMTKKMIYV